MTDKVSIIGAGAFGTALGLAFARAGCAVTLWGRDTARLSTLAMTRVADGELAGIPLEPALMPEISLATACRADLVVIAVPTQSLWDATKALAPLVTAGTTLVSAAKGIERKTGFFVSEIMRDAFEAALNRSPDGIRFGVLSGPSFATDIAKGLPTAIALALPSAEEAGRIAGRLSSPGLRLYHTTDLRGVEIGGAAKNVLAIAAGIVTGMGLGESARAAMITRGFAELRRFAEAHGARPETLMGLSGLGDLVLTASSPQSRNFSLGLLLGEGRPLDAANPSGKLAEGAFTASILAEMARRRAIEMPIVEAVAGVLDGKLSVREAVKTLMTRPLKGE